MENYGIISLIPAATAITLAVMTRQVLPSLFAALWIGATILSGWNPLSGFTKMIEVNIAGTMGKPWSAAFICYSLGLGGLVGIISKAGGFRAVAEAVARRAKSTRSFQFSTLVLGIFIFFDDYVNTLIVGSTMRPLSDRLKVSREKLAYICDSTSALVTAIALISTWTAYEMGVIASSLATLNLDMNVFGIFIQSIPYSFYCIIALFIVASIALTGKDFGPMAAAERRARTTGLVIAPGSRPLASTENTDRLIRNDIPLRKRNALIPIAILIVGVVIGMYHSGMKELIKTGDAALIALVTETPFSSKSIVEILGKSNAALAMMWAAFGATLAALTLVIGQKIMSLGEGVDAWVEGAKAFVTAIMIIILAWGIGDLNRELGTAHYMVGIFSGKVGVAFIPAIVFLVSCAISFATGTAYGTMAIVMPLAVPLGWTLSGGESSLLFATIGSVLSGAVFGDHCSPISDTTILSSMACASDHVDHVRTQMPYALTGGLISMAVGYIPAGFGVSPFISLPIGIILGFGAVSIFGKKSEDIEIAEDELKIARAGNQN